MVFLGFFFIRGMKDDDEYVNFAFFYLFIFEFFSFNFWVILLIYFNYLISFKNMWHFFIFNLKISHVASIEWPLEL